MGKISSSVQQQDSLAATDRLRSSLIQLRMSRDNSSVCNAAKSQDREKAKGLRLKHRNSGLDTVQCIALLNNTFKEVTKFSCQK